MDSKIILYIKDAEEDSCVHCKSGVVVPDDEGRVDFAKCQAETDSFVPLFNFNLYGSSYEGYFPKKGSILSKLDLPCEGKLFDKYKRKK